MMDNRSGGCSDTAFLKDLALSGPDSTDRSAAAVQALAAELLHQREDISVLQFRSEVQSERHPTLSLHQAATW